ncbi:MAG: DUF3892 domain-containing protein [Anaerolineae bacterium]
MDTKTKLQIMCVNKVDRQNPHERITRVGGVKGGARWTHTQLEAIQNIDNRTHEYFVLVKGNETKVIVARSAAGNKYLRTEADSTIVDNLLSLPQCPAY